MLEILEKASRLLLPTLDFCGNSSPFGVFVVRKPTLSNGTWLSPSDFWRSPRSPRVKLLGGVAGGVFFNPKKCFGGKKHDPFLWINVTGSLIQKLLLRWVVVFQVLHKLSPWGGDHFFVGTFVWRLKHHCNIYSFDKKKLVGKYFQ